jgi:hypothetical protein
LRESVSYTVDVRVERDSLAAERFTPRLDAVDDDEEHGQRGVPEMRWGVVKRKRGGSEVDQRSMRGGEK